MGNFSRETFDRLKHYVGVRLQQGVPLVDADWNEQEDIRKFELQAFLKWFVGSGVAEGNDGFRILPAVEDRIILRWDKEGWDGKQPVPSSLEVLIEDSDAAVVLGFDAENCYAERMAPPAAQVAGRHGPQDGVFAFEDTAKVLRIKIDDQDPVDVALVGDMTPSEVADAIANTVTNLEAEVGGDNDFDIKGSSGPGEGPGRCLVEGWDAINESTLSYKAQPLYENDTLAAEWGVAPIDPDDFTTPGANRTDLVYLDLWEREVDAQEDGDLVNSLIGLQTCVRLKREWVVRVAKGVAEGAVEPPAPPEGHVHYPLAFLHRPEGAAAVLAEHIQDLRLTGLRIGSTLDTRQTLRDAFGDAYALDHDGEPNLKVSLREAINALLRGNMPSTTSQKVHENPNNHVLPRGVRDPTGNIWIFWGSDHDGSNLIWFNRFDSGTLTWDGEQPLTTATSANIEFAPAPVVTQHDDTWDIWVFWVSDKEGSNDIWSKRYRADSRVWEPEKQRTIDSDASETTPAAIVDHTGDICLFWISDTGTKHVHSARYELADDLWTDEGQRSSTEASELYPLSTLVDGGGNVWVFWCSHDDTSIHYDRLVGTSWEGQQDAVTGYSTNIRPSAVIDGTGDVWLFWMSNEVGGIEEWNTLYKRFLTDSGSWEQDFVVVNDDDAKQKDGPCAVTDSIGSIWVFWVSDRTGSDAIWYNRYVNGWLGDRTLDPEVGEESNLFALTSGADELWITWQLEKNEEYSSWYKILIGNV